MPVTFLANKEEVPRIVRAWFHLKRVWVVFRWFGGRNSLPHQRCFVVERFRHSFRPWMRMAMAMACTSRETDETAPNTVAATATHAPSIRDVRRMARRFLQEPPLTSRRITKRISSLLRRRFVRIAFACDVLGELTTPSHNRWDKVPPPIWGVPGVGYVMKRCGRRVSLRRHLSNLEL